MTTVDKPGGLPAEVRATPVSAQQPPAINPTSVPVISPETPAVPPADQVQLGQTLRRVQAAPNGPAEAETDIPPRFDQAKADQAVKDIKTLLGYNQSDWEVNAPETVRALDHLLNLSEPEFQHALTRLKQEDGGLFYRRLRANLAEERLAPILTICEQADSLKQGLLSQGKSPEAAQQVQDSLLATAIAVPLLRAKWVADYDTLEHASRWIKPLAGALPAGAKQAVLDPDRPPGPVRKQLRERFDRLHETSEFQGALTTHLRFSARDAEQFLETIKQVQARVGGKL